MWGDRNVGPPLYSGRARKAGRSPGGADGPVSWGFSPCQRHIYEGETVGITVVKRNGEREPYDANKINLAIENATEGLDENITWVTQIASELELTLFDGITTQQLDEAVIQVALQNVKDDPAFDVVAARLLLKTIYKRVLGDYDSADELKALHKQHFAKNITRGVEEGLLDSRLTSMFNLEELSGHLEPKH